MKMQQLSRLKRNVIGMCALRQHWSAILCVISILDTLLASVLLFFNDWIDALAIYFASGLTLAIILSQFAGQYAKPQAEGPADDSAFGCGDDQPELILKSTSQIQP